MKFNFCGSSDCPQWILSQIVILNQISAVRLRLFVLQIIKKLSDPESYDQDKALRLLQSSNFNEVSISSAFSLVQFILTNTSRFQTDLTILAKQLQQLGLAIQNTDAIIKPFNTNYQAMIEAQKQKGLRISKVQLLNALISHCFALSTVQSIDFDQKKDNKNQKKDADENQDDLDEDNQNDTQLPAAGISVNLELKLKNQPTVHEFAVEGKQFLRLMKELKQVRQIMESIDTN